MSEKMISVSKHEKNLRELRCVVTHNPQVTLHHCHGGSLKESGWPVGMGQKQNPYLQIPLKADYHVGDMGIDSGMGVLTWEKYFGTQMEHLERVSNLLNYDVFRLAQEWEEKNRQSMVTR